MKARLFRRWGGILLALSTLLLQLPARAEEPVLDTVRFSWVAGNENAKTFNFTGTTGRFVIDWGDGGKDMITLTKEESRTVEHQYKNEEGEYTVMLSALNQDNANPQIKALGVSQRRLTSLDVSGCTALTNLFCYGNQLTELNVNGCTRLSNLECGNNQLTELDVSGCTALYTLECNSNQLTELNTSGCTALYTLECNSNQLTELNTSGCTALTRLSCNNNQLTELNTSGCTALTRLSCNNNQLTELNVSQNSALTFLNCNNNQLTELDVSKNPLSNLHCRDNQLIKLSVKPGSAFWALDCSNNQLAAVDLNGSKIAHEITYPFSQGWCSFSNNFRIVQINEDRSFDLSTLPDMDTADIYKLSGGHREGHILYFDADIVGYSYNTHLGSRWDPVFHLVAARSEKTCDTVRFDWTAEAGQEKKFGFDGIGDGRFLVDWGDGSRPDTLRGKGSGKYSYKVAHEYTEGKNFTVLLCGMENTVRLMKLRNSANYLTSLDVSGCTALTRLDCSYNQLTDLNISGNKVLDTLFCHNNQLTSLDLSDNTTLKNLDCSYNQLTELDMGKDTVLLKLNCSNNQLFFLNVKFKWYWLSGNDLSTLNCANNQLTELDVSGSLLQNLICGNNKLAKLDASDCTVLKYLSCSNNQLTSLDMTNNTSLDNLNCSYNQLTSLDVPHSTSLDNLNCSYNQLTSLDVPHSTSLDNLNCSYNQLTSFDVTNNTYLTYLNCSNNQLTDLDVSNNKALRGLNCSYNQLTDLDVSNCTYLSKDFSCSKNFRIVQTSSNHSFDLSTLPGIDLSDMQDISGGHLEGCILYFDGDIVKYSYYTGLSSGYYRDKLRDFHLVASRSGENLDTVRFDWTAEAGQEKTFGFDGIGDGRFLVDWGDGSRPDTLSGNGRHKVGHEYTEGKSHTVLLCGLQGTERLSRLNLTHKNLTGLDVSGCLLLLELYCDSNQLAALDVSRNSFLTSLNCSYNQLTDLDVSACSALEDLNCSHNRLKNFGDCMFTELKSVDCSYNRIPLSFLCWYEYKMSSLHDNYWFSDWDQSDSITVSVGEKWDLSSERIIGGNQSTYKIYDNRYWHQEIDPEDYTENDFVFCFNKPGDYYKLVISNDNISNGFIWYVSVEKGTEFTVRVSPNNIYYGTATITGNGSYEEGEEVTITATPKSGYRFVNWSKKDGSAFSTEAVHTFTVTENLELTANFEKTGVGNESATQAGIRVYPNPNSGTFHIDLPEAALLEVFTSNGTLILREQAAAGIKTMQLESGSYLLRITSNTTTTKQIVVL